MLQAIVPFDKIKVRIYVFLPDLMFVIWFLPGSPFGSNILTKYSFYRIVKIAVRLCSTGERCFRGPILIPTVLEEICKAI